MSVTSLLDYTNQGTITVVLVLQVKLLAYRVYAYIKITKGAAVVKQIKKQ